MLFNRIARSASILAIAVAAPAAVYAQETSSEIRGFITDEAGAPVGGASVTVTHVPTGTASVLTTNASGTFFDNGLRVGGPYTIAVSADGFEGGTIEDVRLAAGSQAPFRIALKGAEVATIGVITVTGEAINEISVNNGIGTSYSADDVANRPSISRDLIATLSADPLAVSNGPNNLSVAGVNPRFNGVTIDGARQKDNFGLGSNTFATARSPINIDIVESAAVAASDYSVTASGFTGGLVNVTTKSGTNEIDGSLFYYYRDQDSQGKTAFGDVPNGGVKSIPAPFEEKEYGVTLRGPILKDRLFYSLSYDKFESARQVDFSVSDTINNVNPQLFTTLNNLVQTTYGINMGGRPTSGSVPELSERYFARVDWDITNDHRLQLNYQKTEETGVANVSALNFQSAWYDTPQTLETYSAQLFSDWTSNFSTTLRANMVENARGQICRAGTDVGELQFVLSGTNTTGATNPLNGLLTSGASTRTIIGGCDRFRHANEYSDERLQVIAQADYTIGDFILTGGYEHETFDVFNLFVSDSLGTFVYTGPTAVSNITGRIANVTYRNARSNNVDDAATAWGFTRGSLFGQARWQVLPELELAAGVRYENITTDDKPLLDPTFQTNVGIPNTTTTDGLDIVMPRLSFRWEPTGRTTLSGGFGLFSGGDPAVWTSNAFSPPAVLVTQNNLTGINPSDVPASLITAATTGTATAIDAIDPNFELPSDWKASLKLEHEFDLNFGNVNLGDDYVATLQVIATESEQSFLWREYAQTNAIPALTPGVAPDGRPIYADLAALNRQNRTVLTNSSGDKSLVYTIGLQKSFDNGVDFYASYAKQDVEAITEGTSSRGVSAFRGQVTADRNNPEPRTSFFQIEDSFKLGLSYEREFFQDLATRFDLVSQISSGGVFTYTFDVDNTNSLFGRNGNPETPFDNSPVYIPNLAGDSRVVYATGFNRQAFADYIALNGLQQGQINTVNAKRSAWNQDWDLRIQQDLPGISFAKNVVGDNNFKFVFDVENLGNLLNNSWGTFYNAPANGQNPIIRADLVRRTDVNTLGVTAAPALTNDTMRTACTTAEACVYRFNSFTNRPNDLRDINASVWKIKVGLRYEF